MPLSPCWRLLSKQSRYKKPVAESNGCGITPKNGPGFVEALAVKKFHGVGPATAERMKRHGIETGLDLKSKSRAFLQQNFGKSGPYFYGNARGVDERRVRPDRIRKSVGAEDTFVKDIDDLDLTKAELRPLAEKV